MVLLPGSTALNPGAVPPRGTLLTPSAGRFRLRAAAWRAAGHAACGKHTHGNETEGYQGDEAEQKWQLWVRVSLGDSLLYALTFDSRLQSAWWVHGAKILGINKEGLCLIHMLPINKLRDKAHQDVHEKLMEESNNSQLWKGIIMITPLAKEKKEPKHYDPKFFTSFTQCPWWHLRVWVIPRTIIIILYGSTDQ